MILLYEYGSRAGVWRILRLFREFEIPITIFAVAMAIARNRELADYLVKESYDICAHGLRWIDYQFIDEKTEREHMDACISLLRDVLGERPIGWYTGRNSPNTRRLVIEEGGFLYDSDILGDEDHLGDMDFKVAGTKDGITSQIGRASCRERV